MLTKIIAFQSFYDEQLNWAMIEPLCGVVLDLLSDNNLPSEAAKIRAEYEIEIPEFTSYVIRALASGIEMKRIRSIVTGFTDVQTYTDKRHLHVPCYKPEGGTRSFREITEHLKEKLGNFQ